MLCSNSKNMKRLATPPENLISAEDFIKQGGKIIVHDTPEGRALIDALLRAEQEIAARRGTPEGAGRDLMQVNPPMKKRQARKKFVLTEGDGLFPRVHSITERAAGTGTLDTVVIKGRTYQRARLGRRTRRAFAFARTSTSNGGGGAAQLSALKKKPTASKDAARWSLEQFLDSHFLPGMTSRVRVDTLTSYQNAVRKHINPRIGAARFAGLSASNVSAWVAELTADKKVGPRATQQAFMVLKRAYSYAVELELLDRHPFMNLKAPAAPKREQVILNAKQLTKFLDQAEGTP